MMREKAIIKTIKVTKKNQVINFQMKFPLDAKRIIGVETSARLLQAMPPSFPSRDEIFDIFLGNFLASFYFKRTQIIAEIKLQNCSKENIFYSDDVYDADKNMEFANFTMTPFHRFFPKQWTHGLKKEEDVLNVNIHNPVIKGVIKDQLGRLSNVNARYEIKVIVWYEIKIKDDRGNSHSSC